MNTREDNVWKLLLAQSAPSFEGDLVPPLGLAARVLAGARNADLREAAWERTGLRAILASLAAVVVLGVIAVGSMRPHDDGDMPVRNLAVLENVSIS